jgi:hypothetical protein
MASFDVRALRDEDLLSRAVSLPNGLQIVDLYQGEFPDGEWHLFIFNDGKRLRHFRGCTEWNPRGTTRKDRCVQWAKNWVPQGTQVESTTEEQQEILRKIQYVNGARPLSFLRAQTRRAEWREIYYTRKRVKQIAKDSGWLILWHRHGFDYRPEAESSIWYSAI